MGFRSKLVTFVGASVIALSTPFIAKWEGLETDAYYDIVGVATVCYGETRGVKIGDSYTEEECLRMLEESVKDYYNRLKPYMTNPDIPVGVQASLLELAYNVGVDKAGKSTMMKLANLGKYKEACNELKKWTKAGGKSVKGLLNRRIESKDKLCLKGL